MLCHAVLGAATPDFFYAGAPKAAADPWLLHHPSAPPRASESSDTPPEPRTPRRSLAVLSRAASKA